MNSVPERVWLEQTCGGSISSHDHILLDVQSRISGPEPILISGFRPSPAGYPRRPLLGLIGPYVGSELLGSYKNF